jgi:transcriptional regulator with PAS, ATPase and Fis domain
MSASAPKVGHPVSRHTIEALPEIQQRSVEELIDRNLLEHKRSMAAIMDRFQNTVIVRALALKAGNVSQTAELLQVNRTTLVRWMDKYNLIEPGNEEQS